MLLLLFLLFIRVRRKRHDLSFSCRQVRLQVILKRLADVYIATVFCSVSFLLTINDIKRSLTSAWDAITAFYSNIQMWLHNGKSIRLVVERSRVGVCGRVIRHTLNGTGCFPSRRSELHVRGETYDWLAWFQDNVTVWF